MGVSFLCWFTGMHTLCAFNTVQSGLGVGNEFIYIVAAVVGGCLLTGGFGSAVGAAIGALIFGMASQGIVYANWDQDWFKLFLGIMLLSAVVNAGEVTCVLGDNGAGKSTLIKILAGVHQHDTGSFRVEGNEVRFSSP